MVSTIYNSVLHMKYSTELPQRCKVYADGMILHGGN
jgi:hypothetical protein